MLRQHKSCHLQLLKTLKYEKSIKYMLQTNKFDYDLPTSELQAHHVLQGLQYTVMYSII